MVKFGPSEQIAASPAQLSLPAKAAHISFSAGAIITTSVPASNGGEPTTKDYTISRAVTLEKLSAEAIQENAAFIAAGALEFIPLNAKEREKANAGNGPHLVSPKYASAPNCSEIHRAVKKYVEDHPERVLEVVALQIGHNPSCACEVVKRRSSPQKLTQPSWLRLLRLP